jgi:predicted CXXCH cytochrome family protein
MKKITLLITIIFVIGYVLPALGQGNFNTSLHKTRNGKPTWYNSENGGFETITNVPISQVGCVGCHDANDANGDPYPVTGYSPDCVDCHATNTTGSPVTQADCLGCHSREASIINKGIPDVHRDASTPFTCMDCHKKEELHGDDGIEHGSMFDPGAIQTDCQQAGCHTTIPSLPEHNTHGTNIHCTSCHASTNLTCLSCHFESQVVMKKRAFGQFTNFMILVNRDKDGKVHPASFQSLTYQGNTWIGMGPSVAHTITGTGARTCNDCHANFGGNIPAITDYNNGDGMKFATWNPTDSTMSTLTGIVPLPVDYKYSFKMDFLTYNGDPNDPVQPSKNWSVVKETADGFALRYCTPLTTTQMAKLGMDTLAVSVERQINSVPDGYQLEQNYPNPFNPTTTIRYSVADRSNVEIVVYDALGKQIRSLINGDHDAGVYEVDFDATGLTSGVYFYQIKTNTFTETKKLVLMK